METRQLQICLWCGPAFVLLFGVGLMPLAGLMPPMSPTLTADEVAAFYRHDTNMIRLGLLLVVAACGLFVPWVALISEALREIPGCSRTVVMTQFGCGVGNALLLLVPTVMYCVTAYRPERDPALTYILNDLSWLVFLMPFSLGTVQWAAIALAIFGDKRARRRFPARSPIFSCGQP